MIAVAKRARHVPSFVSKIPPAPIVPCPDEETLFAAVEWKFKKPEERR